MLYALMGIAAFLGWREYSKLTTSAVAGSDVRKGQITAALVVFAAQLALNILWSLIFFGLRSPGWALAEILLLWLAIAATIWLFRKVYPPAAWLLVPYLLWVTFAAYLNYSIWTLNP
jgi:tryptophan-rich sensory protein